MFGSDVPIFIICRDRVTVLLKLISWLEQSGYTNLVLVDNASTYRPLVDYLQTTTHRVIPLQENVGHMAVWQKNLLSPDVAGVEFSEDCPGFYVVTDCDVVPDESCPHDAIERFYKLLIKYPAVNKVGFGLKIDDLPDHFQFKREVREWESQFWEKPVEPGVYDASTDTTFALYRPEAADTNFYNGLRTGLSYVAQHMPWYLDSANMNEEEIYYQEHCLPGVNNWNKKEVPAYLVQLLTNLRASRKGNMTQAFASGYGTHIPLLAAALSIARDGPVLELGSGWSSTLLLNQMCQASSRLLQTVDSNAGWLAQFESLRSSRHELVFAPDWDVAVEKAAQTEWAVILIDHAPAERRIIDIERLAHKTEFMVIHDTEDPLYGYEPALAKFKYRYDYKQMVPHTSVFSNTRPWPTTESGQSRGAAG